MRKRKEYSVLKKSIISCLCLAAITKGQIIADHTIVDKFKDIPHEYIEKVKKCSYIIKGESTANWGCGMELMEQMNIKYAHDWDADGSSGSLVKPDGNWDADGSSGSLVKPDGSACKGYRFKGDRMNWVFDSSDVHAIISHAHEKGANLLFAGVGWGQGGRYDTLNLQTYCEMTDSYSRWCAANNYPTRVFLSTRKPINASVYYPRAQALRAMVQEKSDRIFFDFADILVHNDSGELHIDSETGYPEIHPDNMANAPECAGGDAHLGCNGNIRVGKALWWILARLCGWEGGYSDVESVCHIQAIANAGEKRSTHMRILLNSHNKPHTQSPGLYDMRGRATKFGTDQQFKSMVTICNISR
jgi:hypothetical protein